MKIRAVPILAFVLTASSCMTWDSLTGNPIRFHRAATEPPPLPRVYSGTIFNARILSGAYQSEAHWKFPVVFYPISFIDTFLCLVADTLVLPYTIYAQINYGSFEKPERPR